MRLAYFGSGEFGLPTLEALLMAGHDVAVVVSQPDRPAGRGGKTRPTPISEMAERLGMRLWRPEKPNAPEFAPQLADLGIDLAVVVAYGHLIKKPLLDVPPLGMYNLHASLLPAYRGAAPVPWAILKGETVSGATVFRLDQQFDTGSIYGQVELPIGPDDTSATYLAKLAPLGAKLMADTVAGVADGSLRPVPQDNTKASAAPKFRKEDGVLDWRESYAALDCKVRALQPWPLAQAVLPTAKGELRLNVLKMEPAPDAPRSKNPGDIVASDAKSGLVVMAGDQPVRLVEIKPEGKRAMRDVELLCGCRLDGDCMVCDWMTPS